MTGCNGTGTFTRVWTLSDDCGETTTHTQLVTVRDTIDPTFTVPPPATVYLTATCQLDTTIADIGDVTDESDNCSTGLEATYADDLSALTGCNGTGTFTRIWTLSDDCGETITHTQLVTVRDTIDPTFTVPPPATVYLTATCQLDTTVADIGDVTDESDNCSTGLEATYTDDLSALTGCNGTGTFTRVWTLSDDCGETTTHTQLVTVRDTIDPTFTVPPPATVYLTATCQLDTTVADIGDVTDESDNCSTGLEATYTDDLSALTGCNGTGTFTRIWTLSDDCGETTTHTQLVTVRDTIDPTFTVPPPATVYLTATCQLDTTIADIGDVTDESDNCSTGLEATYADDLSALTGCNGTGTFTRIWTLSDDCGETITHTQLVTVRDTIDPTFTVPPPATVYLTATCQLDTTVADIGDVTDESDNCSTGLEATLYR